MAESVILAAKQRAPNGSSTARNLRKKGEALAVLYGHKEATVPISLSLEELEKALRHGVRVVELELAGKKEQALIQEVQRDHLGMEVLHVDFKRVSKDERVVVNVRLELRGQAPGVTAGGVLDQPLHSISVEALAISLPESIRVNIGELQIDSVLHVRDIVLPPDVKLMTDPDAVVVQVKPPVVEEAAPVAPVEGAAAVEPEVITKRVVEEKEEEEK